MEFKTINKNATAEIVEKKSRFISNVFYIESADEAEDYIKKIKKEYHDAKHNCFAYIACEINGTTIKKCSDDGEPQGTAGAPILKILTEQNLSNILVVVTRYFGGILLGTGGLVRAYSGATLEALKQVDFVQKTLGYEAILETTYKDLEQIKYELEQENIKIKKIDYKENIKLWIEIPEQKFEFFDKKIQYTTKKYVEI